MKIIGVSNFDNEMIDDVLICDNIHKINGETIVEFMNDSASEDSFYFYKLVDSDHELYVFEP